MNMEVQEKLPRKEREKLRKMEEILAAATQVFADKGYENATLGEIAELAEFGKGTLYNYFENKEELFVSILSAGLDDIKDISVENMSGDNAIKEKFRSFLKQVFEYFLQNHDLLRIFVMEQPKLLMELSMRFKSGIHEKYEQTCQILGQSLHRECTRNDWGEKEYVMAGHVFMNMIRTVFIQEACQVSMDQAEWYKDFLIELFFSGISGQSEAS